MAGCGRVCVETGVQGDAWAGQGREGVAGAELTGRDVIEVHGSGETYTFAKKEPAPAEAGK
jgi:hypothetical protein